MARTHMKPILMPRCTIFCHMKPIMLPFCSFEPSIFNENHRVNHSSADSADILPLLLLYEAHSAEILPLALLYEADLAAILPFFLL